MERFTVDRIEEGHAVLEKEDMSTAEIKLSEIPFDIREGNVLLFDGVSFALDSEEEAARRRRIMEKQRNIFKNK